MYEILLDIRALFKKLWKEGNHNRIALERFPERLNEKIKEFRTWYNNSMFHTRIDDIPARYMYT